VSATVLVYLALGYAYGPIWLALIVAYFTAVVGGHRVAAAITAVSPCLTSSLSFIGDAAPADGEAALCSKAALGLASPAEIDRPATDERWGRVRS
jgi:hypothetical protein